jgi:voltage-gated potassium channel Kch
MPSDHGRPSGAGATAKKIAYVGAALIFAAFLSDRMADRRGWALGLLAFLVYGSIFGAVALSLSGVQRWSARHIVLDSLISVPLCFFALLLIPALSWWAAAVMSLVVGGAFAIIRRIAQSSGRTADR